MSGKIVGWYVALQLTLPKMESATRVQVMDEAGYVSLHASGRGKGINPWVLLVVDK